MLSHFSRVQLFATLCLLPASLLCPWGFSRQEYWSRLTCPPPGDFPNPGIEAESLLSPALAGEFFTTSATWEVLSVSHSVVSNSLSPHGLYSPPGSSVHGILQARTLKWIAIAFSKGSSWPRVRTQVSCIAGRFFTIWATKETQINYTSIFLNI